jgi:hypothetical protein
MDYLYYNPWVDHIPDIVLSEDIKEPINEPINGLKNINEYEGEDDLEMIYAYYSEIMEEEESEIQEVSDCQVLEDENIEENNYCEIEKEAFEINKLCDLIMTARKLKDSYEEKQQITKEYFKMRKKMILTPGERKLLKYHLEKEHKLKSELNQIIDEKVTVSRTEYLQEIYRHLIRERSDINQIFEKKKQQHLKDKNHELWDANSWYNSDVKERMKHTKKQMTEREMYESLGYIKKGKNWILKIETNDH